MCRRNCNKSVRALREGVLITGACLFFFYPPASSAQLPNHAKDGPRTDPVPLSLRYDEPKIYPVGSKQSVIISDFRCGSDGTVFFPMIDDSRLLLKEMNGARIGRSLHILLTALTPSGDVIRFANQNIPNLRNIVPEVRYFVSSSRIYILERAERYDEADPKEFLGFVQIIQIYDYRGISQGVIELAPQLNPINIAAYPSGDVLVVSLDKLNQTTRLLIFDSAGRPVKELRLFDNDYMSNSPLAGTAENQNSAGGNLPSWSKLALSQWVPFGDDLLLAPNQSPRLPLIEVNESGIVRVTTAAMPKDAVIGALLSSDDRDYHILVGHLQPIPPVPSARVPQASQKSVFTANEIDDIFPGDGTVLKRVKFAHGLMPVCVRDDTYTFVTPRDEDGRLQLVRGTVIH